MRKQNAKRLQLISIFVAIALSLFFSAQAQAICQSGQMVNISDIIWDCVFPIKLASVTVMAGSTTNDMPDLSWYPVCMCPTAPPQEERIGVTMSFWEPTRYIETVKDPYCFPGMGGTSFNSSDSSNNYNLYGGSNDLMAGNAEDSSGVQAHFWKFDAWDMIGMEADMECQEFGNSWDLTAMTEYDYMWQSDEASALISPDALLFANLAAQVACIIDAAQASIGYSNDAQFWCVASAGSVYPLSKNLSSSDFTMAHFRAAARMTFKIGREGGICDPAVWWCSCIPSPIWIKTHFRIHSAKPVKDYACRPFGQTGLAWESGKNPHGIGDNFLWMLFRKRTCCVSEGEE
ncbi:MAG: hypothetical protein CSYNP_04000 [Syntrophus sp. SKADARSKE-3]|nr:hypothetical protein [Syntrophus sp. SKADARSKE-3]